MSDEYLSSLDFILIVSRLKKILPHPASVPKSLELQKFGEKVRKLRKAKGLSQEKLAEIAGLHPTYIGGIERGERNIALVNIVRLARALEITPSDLMLGIE